MKVLKFGGSSVANAENIQKVVAIIKANSEPQIVVVSALGGVTDLLIKAGTLAEQSDEIYKEVLQQLEATHLDTARALLPVTHQSSCLSMIKQHFNELDEICNSIFYLKELSLRTKDRVISFGELLSSKIISAYIFASSLFSISIFSWCSESCMLVSGFLTSCAMPRAILPVIASFSERTSSS